MSGDSDHTARKCVHRTDRCEGERPVLGGTQIWHPSHKSYTIPSSVVHWLIHTQPRIVSSMGPWTMYGALSCHVLTGWHLPSCEANAVWEGSMKRWHPLAEAMVQDANAAPCTSRGSDFSRSPTLSTRDTILLFFDPARSCLSGWLPSWMVRVHCRKIC